MKFTTVIATTSGHVHSVYPKFKSSVVPKGPKEMLLEWCRDRTKSYDNVEIKNYSSSWANGLAFCALVHSFFPDAFDYSSLTAKDKRANLKLAFDTAETKADIAQLLDLEDMMLMGDKPDWKCIFTYVQSLYRGLMKAK
ncbi:hypothetical protein GJ496_005381 [Pomphorhynchus laevis]|nr:hypothetical protein GJ496_005381 [Pomphorhynchus laevis]